MDLSTLQHTLRQHNQTHLLRWWDELNSTDREQLAAQIAEVDFDLIARLMLEHRESAGLSADDSPSVRARRAQPPAEVVRLPRSEEDYRQWAAAEQRGLELLSAGKVGAILVAGGQGSRLGFDKPKGIFPIGPVSGATLFQILAEQLLARSRQAGCAIPYYVMTSDATHDDTVAFFQQHDFFGLDAGDVHFFRQGNMPAVDAESGRLLMASKSGLCLSPDGHGGMLAALERAGLLADMRRRGVEFLHYHQVDNPTVRVCDPVFLGFHEQRGSEMSTKVVAKRSWDERMGIVVDVDSQTQIVEYIHVPDDVAQQTDADGQLKFWAGSTAVHVFNRTFVERIVGDASSLPFQAAYKKVPHIDEQGARVEPRQENAFKFERFIFDAMPSAATALVVEADRRLEFNPVKNAEGHDSPATAQQALTRLYAGWLQNAGATVADDAEVEISPLFALSADDLRGRIDTTEEYSGAVYLSPHSS